MKTRLHHFARQAAATAALLASALAAQATGNLVVTPAASTVGAGDSFALQVRGSAFTDAVVGGGFSLSFDPAVLTLTSVSIDTVTWEFISSSGAINNALGTLSDVYFNSFKSVLPTGDFNIATLQFSAKAGGSSTVRLGASPSFPFANDLANVIDVSYGQGLVTISAVPEPASLAMLALGLAAVGMRLRRRAA